MKNILKLIILTSILISCKIQNITGTGVDNRFIGTWTGKVIIEENNPNIPIQPPPGGEETTENKPKERDITITINEDGSISIDSDYIPASNIYKDIKNNVHYYTISYITSYEENSSTVYNYMIIFEDNTKATIEGVTITTLNQKEERIKVPQTTINKQTQTN